VIEFIVISTAMISKYYSGDGAMPGQQPPAPEQSKPIWG
jgi:hypothetical protein